MRRRLDPNVGAFVFIVINPMSQYPLIHRFPEGVFVHNQKATAIAAMMPYAIVNSFISLFL